MILFICGTGEPLEFAWGRALGDAQVAEVELDEDLSYLLPIYEEIESVWSAARWLWIVYRLKLFKLGGLL